MHFSFSPKKKNVAKCIFFLVIKKIYNQSRDNKDSNKKKQMDVSAILNEKRMAL